MKKFCVSIVEGDDVRIEVEGDVKDVLTAIGEMIGTLYSAYLRHEPLIAGFFKFGIQQLATNPSAPTWKAKNLPDGGIEIFTSKPKKEGAAE